MNRFQCWCYNAFTRCGQNGKNRKLLFILHNVHALLCVQTDGKANFRGSAITYKVNVKMRLDTNLPRELKIFQLGQKMCENPRALWTCFINIQRWENKQRDWKKETECQKVSGEFWDQSEAGFQSKCRRKSWFIKINSQWCNFSSICH